MRNYIDSRFSTIGSTCRLRERFDGETTSSAGKTIQELLLAAKIDKTDSYQPMRRVFASALQQSPDLGATVFTPLK